MGRKAGVSPEETRAAVLDAALRTFAVLGYHGASTRTIGAAADLTIGAVHHHFGSKVKLYSACVDEAHERVAKMFQTAFLTFQSEGLEGTVRSSLKSLRDPYYALAARLSARHGWENLEEVIPQRIEREGERLNLGAAALSKLTGINLVQARLRLDAATRTISRIAAVPEAQHCFLAGVDDPEEARKIVEDEVAQMLMYLLAGNSSA